MTTIDEYQISCKIFYVIIKEQDLAETLGDDLNTLLLNSPFLELQ